MHLETLESKMGNPEPNPFFEKTSGSQTRTQRKRIGAETQWKLLGADRHASIFGGLMGCFCWTGVN
jgi:hypothetical protein